MGIGDGVGCGLCRRVAHTVETRSGDLTAAACLRYADSSAGAIAAMGPEESKLLGLLVRRSYLYRPERPFVLASGKTSPVYIDCRSTTTFAEAMPLIGQTVLTRLQETGRGLLVDAVGGLTLGADPIAAAVAYHSALAGSPVSWFTVRKEPKQHGTTRWIEGSVEPGARVAIVDDVVTTGASTVTAIERCRDFGLTVVAAIVLVDREEAGGRARIEGALAPDGGVFAAIFTRGDLERARQAVARR
jgi:orotate phosphoribosyltransferase